jgi:hypothetical protein
MYYQIYLLNDLICLKIHGGVITIVNHNQIVNFTTKIIVGQV